MFFFEKILKLTEKFLKLSEFLAKAEVRISVIIENQTDFCYTVCGGGNDRQGAARGGKGVC